MAKPSVLRRIRSALRRMFPQVAVFFKTIGLAYSPRSILRTSGYIESVKTRKPCRRDGSPLPWMNYHVIQFLEQRLTKDLSLFEYGSGNSTLFYAALVKMVVSLEEDEEWYNYIKQNMPQNVTLLHFDALGDSVYSESAGRQGNSFDVIVVDGSDRIACVKTAPAALTDAGVVILDDTHYAPFEEATDFLARAGFRKFDFEGLKPNSIRAYRTTIYYRSNNCLGI